MFSEALHCHFS